MLRFIYNSIFFLIALGAGFFFYKNVFNEDIGIVLAIVGFLAAYGVAMAVGEVGVRRVTGFEKRAIYHTIEEKDRPRILGYSILSLLPIYFCMAIASLIPITTYEVWFVTVFPCIFLGMLPAKEVCDKQYPLTHYKKQFWFMQVGICVAITVFGQILISFLF